MDYATQPSASAANVPNLTELKTDFDYNYDLNDKTVWHAAKSTSKTPTQTQSPPTQRIQVKKQFQTQHLQQQVALKKTLTLRKTVKIKRRSDSSNSSKITPSKELLDNLKLENIVYQGSNVDKPWVCKTCGRNYKWKNSLKCHIKNECGVPPKYHCTRKCGYKTHIHSNLKRHLNSKFCKPDVVKST